MIIHWRAERYGGEPHGLRTICGTVDVESVERIRSCVLEDMKSWLGAQAYEWRLSIKVGEAWLPFECRHKLDS